MAETSRPAFPSVRVCISTVPYFQATGDRASCGIPILRSYCLILAKVGTASVPSDNFPAILQKESNHHGCGIYECRTPRPAKQTPTRVGSQVCFFVGSGESLIPDFPGLPLSRHTAPTAPAPATYEPSV